MLLNLDKQLTDLNNVEMQGDEYHLAKLVAHRIYMSGEELKDPIKFRKIAEKLHQNGQVELDETDAKKIYDFIESGKANLVLGAKGYILEIIDDTIRENKANKNK